MIISIMWSELNIKMRQIQPQKTILYQVTYLPKKKTKCRSSKLSRSIAMIKVNSSQVQLIKYTPSADYQQVWPPS